MVEGRQLLMAMVRQFKDDLEISKAISKKIHGNRLGHRYFKG